MSGEWKGWQSWDRYEKAGIVENAVDFSEEAIIVDHAVGRTKNAIGKCWPMDAAVAYTLMKAGPDTGLTWSDMVNNYTRAAAVMMTGKVGWGTVPKPSVDSCGHDEVIGYNHYMGMPTLYNDESELYIQTGWASSNISEWFTDKADKLKELGHDPVALSEKYSVIRMSKQNPITHSTMVTDEFFAELIDAFQDFFGDVPIRPSSNSSTIFRSINHTYGKCKWADDPNKTCRHHDRPTETMWAMRRAVKGDGFITAWSRAPCHGGWNSHQWAKPQQDMDAKNVVSWDEMRRGMAQAVPEADVIKHIRESLTRMLKRNDNIVSKTGKGKTAEHSWSDWSWLAEMTAYVKNTSSKNRKEGDVENGWKYTKVRSRRSFGHEIADFVWKPVDVIKDYVVGRKEVSDWNASGIMTNLRFSTKQQCIDFMEAISNAHLDGGGHFANRTHDGLEKNDNGEWSIRSIEITVVMYGRIDPEDYLSPQEVVAMWRQGAPAVLEEHKPNFERAPSYTVKQAPPKEEAAVE